MSTLGLLLVIPATAAALLALIRGYRLSAALNVLACLASLGVALSLSIWRPAEGLYLRVDDLSVVFIVLSAFVGLTTSVFSASYIAHEVEIGRLTPVRLRFYPAMYQVLMFAMTLALIANNIGLMWVAVELASFLKLLLYVSLIGCVFVPWGLAPAGVGLLPHLLGVIAYAGKLATGATLLALFETAIAKMRVFRVPAFLGAAFMMGILGVLLLFISRGGLA